jgi:hypothetical protein
MGKAPSIFRWDALLRFGVRKCKKKENQNKKKPESKPQSQSD